MTRNDVKNFLGALGVRQFRDSDNWVNCICPLARWTHERGHRSTQSPSAGVSVNDTGESVFTCFSCSPMPYKLPYLFARIYARTERAPRHAISVYASREIFDGHGLDGVDIDGLVSLELDMWQGKPRKTVKSIPDEVFKLFPLLAPRKTERAEYIKDHLIKDRKISAKVLQAADLRYWTERSKIVVFPFTDMNGTVQVLRCRHIPTKGLFTVSPAVAKMPEVKFPTLKASGAWFGLHLIDWSKPVLIVEGEIDAMRVKTLGFANVIAAGGKHITDSQLANLPCSTAIMGLDADKAGREAMDMLGRRLAKRCGHVLIVDWKGVKRKDPGELADAGELNTVLAFAKPWR